VDTFAVSLSTQSLVAVTVGVRELRGNLRAYLDRAEAGEEIIVTERGKPVAKIVSASGKRTIEQLIAEGRARPALRPKQPIDRSRQPVVRGRPTVADILVEQRH
jgi:prevent-host-death family protein